MEINFNNIDLTPMLMEKQKMYEKCQSHFACEGCELYVTTAPYQIGDSVFFCENAGKGMTDGSNVQE